MVSILGNENDQKILIFGGKSEVFSSMAFHYLKILPFNKKNTIKCMRNHPKTEEEKAAEEKAYQYIFEVTKRNNKIKDDLLSEKVKQVTLLKQRAVIERELMELRNENDAVILQKEDNLNRVIQENQQKLTSIESRLEIIELEEMREKIRSRKQVVLQEGFQNLFDYPMNLYKLVLQALHNKGKEGNRDKDLRTHLEQQLPQIKSTRDKLTNNVASVKRFLGDFHEGQKKIEKEVNVLEADLTRLFPAFKELKTKLSEPSEQS
jgi:hypothetical protein